MSQTQASWLQDAPMADRQQDPLMSMGHVSLIQGWRLSGGKVQVNKQKCTQMSASFAQINLFQQLWSSSLTMKSAHHLCLILTLRRAFLGVWLSHLVWYVQHAQVSTLGSDDACFGVLVPSASL